MAGFRTRLRLGDVLVQEGIITEEQLQGALSEQKRIGGLLGEVMVTLGLVTEEKLVDEIGRAHV